MKTAKTAKTAKRAKRTEQNFIVNSTSYKVYKALCRSAKTQTELKALFGNTYYELMNKRKDIFGKTSTNHYFVKEKTKLRKEISDKVLDTF